MKNICRIDGCEKTVHGRMLCSGHYQKWAKYGDPEFSIYHRDPEKAFSAYTKREGGCLVWTAGKDKDGYGKMTIKRRTVRAHRYAWERSNGPIPEGMHVDHTCWNTSCVDTAHLRVVTNSENQRYRNGASSDSATGVRNVVKYGNRFYVYVGFDGEQKCYGSYPTLEKADKRAREVRAELFGEYAGR